MIRELIRVYFHYSGQGIRFQGDFRSWQDASADAPSYDKAVIFVKTRAAALAVQAGRAAFDRDGMLFAEQDYPFPLLSGIVAAYRSDWCQPIRRENGRRKIEGPHYWICLSKL